MKKIFRNILLVAAGAFALPFAVNAAPVTVDTPSAPEQNATVAGISTTDTYDVELEWGELSYTFKKGVGDNYTWEPTSEQSNVVRVSNRQSTTKITATIGWTPTITGVTANMAGKFSNGTTVCNVVSEENEPGQWSQGEPEGYTTSDDPNEVFYIDNNCETEVTNGTPYVSGDFFKKGLHETVLEGSSVNLDYQTGEGENTITQSAGWEVNLTGGTLENVQTAFAGDKVIGRVTLTISKFVEPT